MILTVEAGMMACRSLNEATVSPVATLVMQIPTEAGVREGSATNESIACRDEAMPGNEAKSKVYRTIVFFIAF